MRSTALGTCAAALLVGVAATASAAPQRLPSYQQWQSDVTAAIKPATPWLEQRVGQGGSKLAIVLDIDNTSLESEYHEGAPNKPVRAVATWAAQHGVAVLFATGRKESGRSTTERQLTAAGYQIDGLCMKNSHDSSNSATKQRCRKEYTSAGYTITANIGNRSTDFEGANYEKGFKLPDYDGQLS
ncbi:putative secreted acid phosphatase [Kutzneria viridogrisea]|nr:HAD family acid phosphatase [Kutzneria albida]MBA8927365.1 putative secreted acid phosphatase [Kutzneria viridogrisea]